MFDFLLKKPVLAIGILFVIILMFQLKNSGYFEKRSTMYTASSCKAITIKLNRVMPKDWKTECSGHFADKTDTLSIKVPSEIKDGTPSDQIRVLTYREMANHLSFISKNSPLDNLEKLSWVKLSIIHSSGQADGVTQGNLLAKMSSIKTPQGLIDHLKASVQVKDNFK